jgi:cyclopropane-fatty-acyl-phospholipid synthase
MRRIEWGQVDIAETSAFNIPGEQKMSNVAKRAIDWTEQGLVPDAVIRHGIRRLIKQRLAELRSDDCEAAAETQESFLRRMGGAEIAPVAHLANEQHYEVPAAFFEHVLGMHRKYSSCCWKPGTRTLDEAERAALQITCGRAQVGDGMSILELGCGWGSLSLWMAERYPASRITAVSNSRSQRAYIQEAARNRGLTNITVITSDMNEFDVTRRFDRILSVEMFEHMRNWPVLFARISKWLKPTGRFFMHVFCHRDTPYAFVDNGPSDWMSRHFFSGGIMPSDDLALHCQEHLKCVRRWRWDGTHYEKTANMWLSNMDGNRPAIWPILEDIYGPDAAQQWWMRWRIFFMACAELFGYDNGQQWWVSHYLFQNRTP